MASGKFSNNKGGYHIITEWTSTPNILENTSTVVCTHKFKCASGWALYVGDRKVTCTVGSDTKSFYTSKLSSDGGTTVTIGETTHIVPHNSDGTMSVSASTTCKLQANIGSGGTTTWYEEVKATTTMTLDNIPRASTLEANNDLPIGSEMTLKITKAVPEFIHTITYACGTHSDTIITRTSEDEIKWTPPLELASQNTTGETVAITFAISTYNGDDLIGTSTTAITCTIPYTIQPSVDMTVEDAMGYEQPYGGYIQGLSKFKVNVTGTPAYGSPIASYVTTVNGTTYNSASFVTDVIKNSGESVISTIVTDQRRHSGSKSVTKNVLPYSKPTLKLSVARCNQNGDEDNQGEYMRIKYSCSITPLNNKNTLTSVIKYKQSSSNVYNSMIDTYANLFDINNHIELVDLYHNWENGYVYEAAGYYSFRIPVKPNTTYVASSNVEVAAYNNLVFYDGSMNYLGGSPYNTADKVFTTSPDTYFITIAVPTTYAWFQLEEGSIVHPYIAFGTTPTSYTDRVVVIPADAGSSYDIELDISDNFSLVTKKTSVSTAFTFHHYKGPNSEGEGKNKLNVAMTTTTINGITATYNESDKSITLDGTCTADNTCIGLPASGILRLTGVYTLSYKVISGSISSNSKNSAIQLQCTDDWTGIWVMLNNNSGAFVSNTLNNQPLNGNAIRIDKDVVCGNFKILIQLEAGNEATDFEPYIPAYQASMGLGKLAELEGGLDIGFKTRFEHGFVAPVLKPETDLNNVIEPNFYAGADANANKYANCPVAYGTFHLEVVSAGADGQLMQRVKECTKDIHTPEYTRYSYGDGYWGAWMKTFDQSDLKGALLDLVYPVGSIYMSVNLTEPYILFGGGTWERIQDTFLLAAGSTYGAGTTGGEASVTLTIDQMPKHNHVQSMRNPDGGSTNPAGGNKNNEDRVGPGVEYKSALSWQLGNQEKWAAGYTMNTYSRGGSQAHNNMPPYLAVYVWKRIG